MKTIVVATNFSERSDRAIRRAMLLARELNSIVHLVHVIDHDQAQTIVQAERDASTKLLEELTHTLEDIDAVKCDFRVVLGKPFSGITQAARDRGAELIIIGPHRRQLLRDILVGTTAERTIRTADRPVLMANGVPTGSYRRAIAATDISSYSEATIRTAKSLGLLDRLNVSLLHVFNAPGISLMSHASLSDDEKRAYIMGERMRASKKVMSFIERIDVKGIPMFLRPASLDIADTICTTAEELSADLIVIGTCGRSTIARALMGSVTEDVLRNSDRDVLAVPPQQNEVVLRNHVDRAFS